MSVKVNYKDEEILSINTDTTKKLTTQGQYCEDDIEIINTQDGGGSSIPAVSKGVNFIDYDGAIVEAWETAEVANKTALPNNPSHDGLTAQGWNWSLTNIKSYIADYPDATMYVGQMYITSDGKTRIYIHLEDGRLDPRLALMLDGFVRIDWGDGTATDTMRGNSLSQLATCPHIYAYRGDYVITIDVVGGSANIAGKYNTYSKLLCKSASVEYSFDHVYQAAVRRVEIGRNVGIEDHAFQYCTGLHSITIPNSITNIGQYAFNYCINLARIILPNSVQTISTRAFMNCTRLTNLTMPNSVTNIGQYAFAGCYSLRDITISNSIEALASYAFSSIYSLNELVVPNGVSDIGQYAFYNCIALTNLTISNSVSNISKAAFMSSSYGLGYIKFTSMTPPIIESENSFASLPTDCIIYVPRGSLSAYQSATNYPNPSTYTYEEYDL